MSLPYFKGLVNCLLDVAIPTMGETIRYFPKSGGDYTLKAVFDRNFIQVDPETQVEVASNLPAIGVNLNRMFEKPQQGDRVRIGDEWFRVTDSQEDGQGGATLMLQNIDDLDDPDGETDI